MKIRAGKNNKQNFFVAENGPFGTPLLAPKIPRKVYVGPVFCVLFQEMRRINCFWGPKLASFGWGPKSLCEKVMCFFRSLGFPDL